MEGRGRRVGEQLAKTQCASACEARFIPPSRLHQELTLSLAAKLAVSVNLP